MFNSGIEPVINQVISVTIENPQLVIRKEGRPLGIFVGETWTQDILLLSPLGLGGLQNRRWQERETHLGRCLGTIGLEAILQDHPQKPLFGGLVKSADAAAVTVG